jgi:hypothetical protein
MSEDMEKRVQQFIALRDALKVIDEAHDAQRKQYVEAMAALTGIMQAFMEANKVENLKTSHGTCYTATKFSASLADPGLFMKHVIDTQSWDLLDRRANVTAVKEYVEQHNGLPPGVNLTSSTSVNVRRPTGK